MHVRSAFPGSPQCQSRVSIGRLLACRGWRETAMEQELNLVLCSKSKTSSAMPPSYIYLPASPCAGLLCPRQSPLP
jgi:hypothetical protein